jgi:hypothetical protein
MNKSDHSIVPEIDTGIRASKENAIGVENTDKSRRE